MATNMGQLPRAIFGGATIATADVETGAITGAKVAANTIATADLDVSTIQYAEVSLTNTNILALRATPITLVAAPGAGKFIEFVSAIIINDYTGAYTETADNLVIRLTDGTGTIVSQAIEMTGFADATADTITNALPKADAISAKSACENKLLCIHNSGDGEFGGGNAANVWRVKVAYRVHTTGW